MKQKTRESLAGWSFVGVSLLGVLIFSVIPFIISISYSFSNTTIGFQFAGFQNYLDLFSSKAFLRALGNTLRFIVCGVPLLMLFSGGLALIFNHLNRQNFRRLDLWFALSLIPMLIPSSVTVLFVRIFFDTYGIVNGWLQKLNLEPVDWMNSNWAVVLLIGIYLWKNFSYITVILLGALQSIPLVTLEAAQLDGANSRQILLHITLPQILPFLEFSLLLSVMDIFKMFRESYLLFGDYPHDSVYMLQNFMNNNFYSINYQRLSSASVIFCLLISAAIFFMVKRRAGKLSEGL